MQVVTHPAQEEVTEVVVVTPAKPATYDLTGLSKSQLAFILAAAGVTRGEGGKEAQGLYNKLEGMVGDQSNDFLYATLTGHYLELPKGSISKIMARM